MKSKAFTYQLLLITLGVASVFGLYFFGKTTQPISIEEASSVFTGNLKEVDFDTKVFLQNAQLQLTNEEKQQYKNTSDAEKVSFWQSIDRNDVASFALRDTAEQTGNAEAWSKTGDSFLRAFREAKDSIEQAYFLQESVSSYQKSLDFQQDISTKIKLAKIHTSFTGAIMKGVQLYREVLEVEPGHIQANYELGLLSLQSGQIDKALERFDLLIKAEPEFIEPYIYKAQILLDNEQNKEAIDVLNVAIQNSTNENGIKVLQEMKKNIR